MTLSPLRLALCALLLSVLGLGAAGCDKVKSVFAKKSSDATSSGTAGSPAPGAKNDKPGAKPAATPVAATTPTPPPQPSINKSAAVMVLCYHRFEEKPHDALAITPAEFEKELQSLKDDGFTVIGMQQFLAWRRGEKDIPNKSAVITIDDGYLSGYETAWPILKKFGYPFTMFVYINYIGSGGKSISWDQLAEMRDAGVDIQCHTYSHSNLKAPGNGVDRHTKELVMKDIQTLGQDGWLRKEIQGSKQELENRLGIKVNALAYPFGIYSPKAREMVKEAGYEAAFTVYGQRLGNTSPPADLLGRYAIEFNKPQIFADALKMIGGGVSGPLPATGPAVSQLAAASMVTQPMNDEKITNPKPLIKANLATMGELDANSVAMRISGIGPVAAQYDPKSKTVSYQVTQPLRDQSYTVIIAAKSGGKPLETRWSFTVESAGGSASSAVSAATPPGKPKP
jgi:peptidoglycan/xylan/chitin deacetylase (PgdA/CDA1 family)